MPTRSEHPTRRQFNILAAGTAAAIVPYHSVSATSRSEITVAAVQMHAALADVDRNPRNAARLVEQAVKQGARIVVLPEFFTSGLGYHPAMMHAHRPLNGEPMQLLKHLSKTHGIMLGGSFLAESNEHVYNTFVLTMPDGRVFTHDKDFPTGDVEQLLYAAGEDAEFLRLLRNPIVREVIPARAGNNVSGVFDTGNMRIGNAMCWELVRKRTDRRLLAQTVDVVLAASGWWHFSDPNEAAEVYGATADFWKKEREEDHASLIKVPTRLAKMVGAPVIHANLIGTNESFEFPTGRRNLGRDFLGESQVVDFDGREIARRTEAQGEGIVVANIAPGHHKPKMEIGDGSWHIHKNLEWWHDGYGRDYYLTVTQPQRGLYAQSQQTSDDD